MAIVVCWLISVSKNFTLQILQCHVRRWWSPFLKDVFLESLPTVGCFSTQVCGRWANFHVLRRDGVSAVRSVPVSSPGEEEIVSAGHKLSIWKEGKGAEAIPDTAGSCRFLLLTRFPKCAMAKSEGLRTHIANQAKSRQLSWILQIFIDHWCAANLFYNIEILHHSGYTNSNLVVCDWKWNLLVSPDKRFLKISILIKYFELTIADLNKFHRIDYIFHFIFLNLVRILVTHCFVYSTPYNNRKFK